MEVNPVEGEAQEGVNLEGEPAEGELKVSLCRTCEVNRG